MADIQLKKTYDFSSVEGRLYGWWEEKGYFRPRGEGSPFVISMPPPNITGELHLGHAITTATQDLMIRHSRMKGVPTLWVPGSDHASIATELQLKKQLEIEGTSAAELGRDRFIERAWQWKDKYGGIITEQLRRLGASCDWERERFTLDEGLSRAVIEAFVRLYEKGLIYRGDYLINWSPGLQTAVSDLEVEYREEMGTLYTFKYPLEKSDEYIPVATTRPETILGDTAVAVHPEDERYRKFIGQTCLVPILKRSIPVIEDEYVDREFGTGALKITPGHDPSDYEIGKRHDLPIVNVLNKDATMSDAAGPYAGLDRYECRETIWADMEAAGLTIKTEEYLQQVPRSQRGGEIIEPMISTQWFVRMDSLATPAIEAVREGRIKIVPRRFEKVYFNWLENIRDWTISRQLWWGHRIPAWHCSDCGEITVAREAPTICSECKSSNIARDPDVLDTWFSSALWPFSTLGWPAETEDLKTYYPTSLMETGYDILFFWVARMIMTGLEFTGQEPFHTVYLHGLVRAADGRKMSKTLGNVIDPLKIMDEFGTDALRFTLLTGSSPGQDLSLSMERLAANRNFANKLWNAGRLVINAVEAAPEKPEADPARTASDQWILGRMNQVIRDVDRLFARHQYGEAGRQIYEFFWSEFADWHLEISKIQTGEGGDRAWLTARILVHIYHTTLRLLHPFMPFVTEELFGLLKTTCEGHPARFGPGDGWEEALIIARWPDAGPEETWEAEGVAAFQPLKELVVAVRNLRAEKEVEAAQKIPIAIKAGNLAGFFEANRAALAWLARLDPEAVQIAADLDPPEGSLPLVVGQIEAYIPLAGLRDPEQERLRITKELTAANDQVERLERLLSSEFSKRAPAEVVGKERDKLAALQGTASKLKQQLAALKRG
ncbi:MAG: valine--tRNA ligase [Chloroflexi bacterium]|nr:valine--tRNA ligase [Chloroflexota bacterium]MCI0772794.1 valine--tRNA ligase [Chloroflexota bacterium]MCI0805731.1 valine--tRNA ligase [Chloroflexota bacterium]MCI0826444.1 valine--tRNA ligase [Chloroflexota bacterium]MCI0853532.1 valine--tRNA ligase [Chloroflexota bacterium]